MTLTDAATFVHYPFAWAKTVPERVAIRGESEAVTYADLCRRAVGVAEALRAMGVAKGNRVAVCVAHKPDFVVAVLGSMLSGAMAVPIFDPTPAAQAHIISDSRATAVLHDAAITPEPSVLVGVKTVPVNVPSSSSAAEPMLDELTGSDPAGLLYTSGTQGRSKGVIVSHDNLLITARYLNAFMELTVDAIEYISSPLHHAFGLGRARCVLVAGGTMVLARDPFNAAKMMSSLRAHRCTALSGVAATFALLLERFRDGFAELIGQLRWMEIGSQPMQVGQKEELLRLFPNARIAFNYGMTEAMRSPLLDLARDCPHLASSGKAAPGTAVRIVDDAGVPLAAGIPGIIEVAGAHVALGYWGREDLWKVRFKDGWFRTDDYGTLDATGYLHYIARRDDLINIAGEKIDPTELERAFGAAFPDLVIFVSVEPDDIRGEAPVLCIEDNGVVPPAWSEIRRLLVGTVANRFLPQRAYVLPAIPRTSSGKIQRARLRQIIQEGAARKL